MAKDYMLRVRLSDKDVATLDKCRGELSRSEYVRKVVFGTPAMNEKSRQLEPPKPTQPKPQDDRFCEHGVLKSEHNCRACDLARAPKIEKLFKEDR